MDKRFLVFVISITTSLMLMRSWYATPEIAKPQQEQAPQEVAVASTRTAQVAETPKYFVLENDYQQIVFSSQGGSITEINLPFHAQSKLSCVLPTADDTQLALYPENVQCPLTPHALSSAGQTVVSRTTYHPLIRRSYAHNEELAAHRAFALTSQYPEFASLPFKVVAHSNKHIIFEAKQPHRTIRKQFSFPENPEQFPYCFNVSISIEGDAKDIWITSGVPEAEWIAGASGAMLQYRVTQGNTSSVKKIDLPKTSFTSSSIVPDWVSNSNGFFGIIMDPINTVEGFALSCVPGSLLPSRLSRIRTEELHGYEAKIPFPKNTTTVQFRVFAGPLADKVLSTIDSATNAQNMPTNYQDCQTFHGWFSLISEPFAKCLFFIMKGFYAICGSWGLSIILVTIALRILLYPLNQWSFNSMRAMQQIAPQVKAIQEQYKKEPSKLQKELMELYKTKKVNPFSGCLPMFIQMPFLIGMFDLLKSSFELRGVALIPGWIDDLAAPDVLFSWSTSFFMIGNQLHVLPIILGATMWWQQHISAGMSTNPQEWTDQQRQQRAVGNIVTVVMTLMFYQFPAGLNIYWISSMALGIMQQWWTMRRPSQR